MDLNSHLLPKPSNQLLSCILPTPILHGKEIPMRTIMALSDALYQGVSRYQQLQMVELDK